MIWLAALNVSRRRRSRMSWRLRLSVETILRLTPAVLGSTVFSIAGLCAAHACLDDQALPAAREAHRAFASLPRSVDVLRPRPSPKDVVVALG